MDLVNDVDARVLFERALPPDMPVVIGRVAGEAAHVDDVTLAAQGFEQPGGAQVGVLLLVVGDQIGIGIGHGLVDRDDRDACFSGLGQGRVHRVRTDRVDDDRVHFGSDEVPKILELTGGIGVAMVDRELGDFA